MPIIPSVPGRRYSDERSGSASSGEWNNTVDRAEKYADHLNEYADHLNDSLDRLIYGESFRGIEESIKRDMSIDINSLENAISIRSVRQIIYYHIANNDEIAYLLELDAIPNSYYLNSVGKAFSIKLNISDGFGGSIVIAIGKNPYLYGNEITINLSKNTHTFNGYAKDLFQEKWNLNFNYIEDHIYVYIDEMPKCIQKELYERKKEQLELAASKKKSLREKIKQLFPKFRRK